MISPFQQKYINNWVTIANTYAPVILKAKRAMCILSYLGVELGKDRRRNYVVEIVKSLRP